MVASQQIRPVEQLLDRASDLRLRAPELALVLGERAAALAEAAGSDQLWLRAEALVVYARVRLGDRAPVTARAVAALRSAEHLGYSRLAAEIRTDLAVCARSVGLPLTGLALLRPVLTEPNLEPGQRATALSHLVGCLAQLGRKQELDRVLLEADRLCLSDEKADADTRLVMRSLVRISMSAHRRRHGDLTGAADAARTGLGFLEQLADESADGGLARSRLVLQLVSTLLDRGNTDMALELAEPVLATPPRAGAIGPVSWLRLAVATRVHMSTGAGEAAGSLLREAVYDAERHGLHALTGKLLLELAHVEERMGRPAEALENLRRSRAAEQVHLRVRRQACAVLTGEFGGGEQASVDLTDVLARSGHAAAAFAGPQTTVIPKITDGPPPREVAERKAKPKPKVVPTVKPERPKVVPAPRREPRESAAEQTVVHEAIQAPRPRAEPPRREEPARRDPARAERDRLQAERTDRERGERERYEAARAEVARYEAAARAAEETRAAEAARAADAARAAEAARLAELERAAEAARLAEVARRAEAARYEETPRYDTRVEPARRGDDRFEPQRSGGARYESDSYDSERPRYEESYEEAPRYERVESTRYEPAPDSPRYAVPRAEQPMYAEPLYAEAERAVPHGESYLAPPPAAERDYRDPERSSSRSRRHEEPHVTTRHDSEHGSVAARSVLDRLGVSSGAGGGRRRAGDKTPGEPGGEYSRDEQWTPHSDETDETDERHSTQSAHSAHSAQAAHSSPTAQTAQNSESEVRLPMLRLPPSLAPMDDYAGYGTPNYNLTGDGDYHPPAPPSDFVSPSEDPPPDAGLAELLALALAEHRAGTSSASALVKRLGSQSETETAGRSVNGSSRRGESYYDDGHRRTNGA